MKIRVLNRFSSPDGIPSLILKICAVTFALPAGPATGHWQRTFFPIDGK
jgi:hypothetical protein